jgi:hypothetical protein
MTNLEALQSVVAGYPLSTNTFIKALTDRGMTYTDTYSGRSQSMDLATADLYVVLATGANVTEGGYSINISNRDTLLKLANDLYQRWGYPSISGGVKKIKSVNPW